MKRNHTFVFLSLQLANFDENPIKRANFPENMIELSGIVTYEA
jgi:hypothetical protein